MRQLRQLTDSKIQFQSYAETVTTENPDAANFADQAKEFVTSLKKFDKYGLRRTLHGFYYISHYYPLRAMDEIDGETAKEMISSLAGGSFEAYLHYPFCEQICTFCHFHKKVSSTALLPKRELDVVDSLIAELELNKSLLGEKIKTRSLQLGGGTPSLMSNDNLKRLLDACDSNMEFTADAEIKTEIYPKSYDIGFLREKLRILKSFGFTDLVIDLESGNSEALAKINRSNSSLDEYLRLIDVCREEGFTSIITAVMAGLPYETYESMFNTVDTLSKIDEIKVINVFPTIVRDTDPLTSQMEKSPEGFNSAFTRDAMWVMARKVLHSRGFVDGPISYLHRKDIRPEQQADKFECVNLLGIGPSAFGYLNGSGNDWAGQYFNYCNTEDHSNRIKQGLPAIWRVGKYDNQERARRKVIFGLANVKVENLIDIEEHYSVSMDEIYGRTFNALLELNLIEVIPEEQGIRYTEEGLARLEEITYFLYSKFAKDRCDQPPEYGDPHYQALINQHYTVTIDPKDRDAFEEYELKHDNKFMWRLKAN